MLYIIGLGLGDEKDITIRGLESIKKCDTVYLENYTSILGVDKEKLSEFYGKKVILADRDNVEIEAEIIYESAKNKDVAFLVVGDPFCATTHSDLIIRAKNNGVKVQIIHNTSVMGAVGACGLQLYNYGQTISIPFFTDNWRPHSFYDKILYNRKGGMHTLCLLDIKVKEPDFDALCRGKKVNLPPRFMTINQAIQQLLEIEDKLQKNAYSKDTICVGMARLGQPTQCIISGKMIDLLKLNFGEPLHSLVIVGDLQCLEKEMLNQFMFNENTCILQNRLHIENEI